MSTRPSSLSGAAPINFTLPPVRVSVCATSYITVWVLSFSTLTVLESATMSSGRLSPSTRAAVIAPTSPSDVMEGPAEKVPVPSPM